MWEFAASSRGAVRVAYWACWSALCLSGLGVIFTGVEVARDLRGPEPQVEYHAQADGGTTALGEKVRRGNGFSLASVRVSEAVGHKEDPSAGEGFLYALQQMLPALLLLGGLLLLFLVLQETAKGRPFGRSQSRRIAALGWLLLLGLPAVALARYLLADVVLPDATVSEDLEPPPLFTLVSLAPGLLVLALATVFRHGAELQQLDDTTV